MSSLISLIVANLLYFICVFIGFLLGATLVGAWVYRWSQGCLLASRTECSTLQQQLYSAREELAHLQGQQGQMASQLDQQGQLLKEARLQLGQEFENLANRIFEHKQRQFQQQSQTSLDQSLKPFKQQMDDFKKQVADVYQKESAERNQLIGKIGELQQQTQKIGEDAVNLALALKGDNKSQGNWGEVILERLLEESGLQKGREYETQVTLDDDSGKRRQPDVIIYLPEDKQLVIDAKVSLVSYECYMTASDEALKAEALQAHIQSVRSHIKTLSKKNYESLNGLQSLDFVFLFMPVEAAFMLALQQDPRLFRDAYDQQIVLVSPTTLLATLRTVANIWRYHKQHKNAEKIAQQAGGLYDQFVLVVEALDDVGTQIEKTQDSYTTARKRLVSGRGNLVKRIEGLRQLGAKTKRSLPVDQLLEEDDKEGLQALEEGASKRNSSQPSIAVTESP